jgi:hypothetical protein
MNKFIIATVVVLLVAALFIDDRLVTGEILLGGLPLLITRYTFVLSDSVSYFYDSEGSWRRRNDKKSMKRKRNDGEDQNKFEQQQDLGEYEQRDERMIPKNEEPRERQP